MKLAIYGKGGIGKSTLTANVSAALAEAGLRVLQIGCDPKHDSTRLLLNGRVVKTVLDYMRDTPPAEQHLEGILHVGFGGVTCAEAGGPEPGVGCAGRGILSAFALFDRLGMKTETYDMILYDVLGDVVCGGFAVPLRKGFADRVFVVTSEEFMAIYAANNILRGVRNFDGDGFRLAGMILNSRGREEDPAPVERFAQATGLPIVGRVPRSDLFRIAEQRDQTVIEAFARSPESDLFRELAQHILTASGLFEARPLSDEALEQIVLSRTPTCPAGRSTVISAALTNANDSSPAVVDNNAISSCSDLMSKSMLFREPLHGCAFTGAISTTTQIRGALTVAHGPRSCAHIADRTILSSGIRSASKMGCLFPLQLAPSLLSSDMDEKTVIYGGGDNLRQTLRKAMSRRPDVVFTVTSCPAGIIGDDPHSAIRDMRDEFPDIPVIHVATDGNIEGDYMQGVINACTEAAARLIDPTVEPEGDRVNILAEKNIANNAERNFRVISELLQTLDVEVNCRFVRDTTVEDLRNFGRARLNLLAYADHFGRVLRSFFTERFGSSFSPYPFPVGPFETERWLLSIGSFFGRTEAAQKTVNYHRQFYNDAIRRFQPLLAGKRLMIVSYIHDVDWILETAFDLGMVVDKVGILNYSQDHLFHSRFRGRFELEIGYTAPRRDADIETIRPDLILSNYVPHHTPLPIHVDGIPLCPNAGFYGGLALAGRWASLLKSPVCEGWRNDGS